jgi:ABC-type Fe3+ transport system permease subunit
VVFKPSRPAKNNATKIIRGYFMEKRLKVAAIMLYVFAAYLILFGLLYLLSPRIMPYHERFLGKTYEQLDPKTAILSLASLKVVGSLALSMGIGFVMMIRFQFSRGDRYAWWIILVMSLLALVPITVISFIIGGVHSPGWSIVISLLVMSVAMAISRDAFKKP